MMRLWKKERAHKVSRGHKIYDRKSRYNSLARARGGDFTGRTLERRGSSMRETFRNKRARTSTARKPVDVSDVWGGVRNRFKNAAADRTSNPFYRPVDVGNGALFKSNTCLLSGTRRIRTVVISFTGFLRRERTRANELCTNETLRLILVVVTWNLPQLRRANFSLSPD